MGRTEHLIKFTGVVIYGDTLPKFPEELEEYDINVNEYFPRDTSTNETYVPICFPIEIKNLIDDVNDMPDNGKVTWSIVRTGRDIYNKDSIIEQIDISLNDKTLDLESRLTQKDLDIFSNYCKDIIKYLKGMKDIYINGVPTVYFGTFIYHYFT